MIPRRASTGIRVGLVAVGGGAPITVQSMTKTDTRDIHATLGQIAELADCGCDIVRVAVPDQEAVDAIRVLKRESKLPLVADIHFDHRLALRALEAGVDGLRINPGNIRDKEQIARMVRAAKARTIPIRIGVNAGSLPQDYHQDSPVYERMVNMALDQVKLLEDLGFSLIKLSLKAFDVPTTVEAYRLVAEKVSYPLHLGITEAGLPREGAIRSAVGLGILLYEGIGDTIRVSLTGHPCSEVRAGYEILRSLNLRPHGPTLVSCPTCGRTEIDLVGLAERVNEYLKAVDEPIKVAVMGCVVNGPGEARDADVGIAGGRGKGAVFRKGQVVATVPAGEIYSALIAEIEKVREERRRQVR